jgi:hypothetical protein
MNNGMTKPQTETMSDALKIVRKARNDPEFAQMMADHGYDEASWDHFDQLIATAAESSRARVEAEAVKLGATDGVKQQRIMVWDLAQRLKNICYIVFQGQTEILTRLGLHRSRRDGSDTSYRPNITRDTKLDILIPWLRNLVTVIQASPEIASLLAKNGFPADKVAALASAIDALDEARHGQEEATLNRTEVRLKRDGAFKALAKWLRCAQETADDEEEEERREMEAGPVSVFDL